MSIALALDCDINGLAKIAIIYFLLKSHSGNLTNHHLALAISLILILSNRLVDCFEKTGVASVSD